MSLRNRDHRVSFQKRVAQGNDGLGNVLSPFVEQFQTRVAIKYLRGGEDVMASRLEGRQPAIATALQSSNIDLVSPDWRMVDVRTNDVWNVRSAEPMQNRRYVDFLIERGVADG